MINLRIRQKRRLFLNNKLTGSACMGKRAFGEHARAKDSNSFMEKSQNFLYLVASNKVEERTIYQSHKGTKF